MINCYPIPIYSIKKYFITQKNKNVLKLSIYITQLNIIIFFFVKAADKRVLNIEYEWVSNRINLSLNIIN